MAHQPLPPQSSLGYQVNHLARLMALGLRDRIDHLGVAPGQFAQLLALYETDGLTQAELCDRVKIEQPTMARTLARMERDGLVTRAVDADDRRRSRVHLTDRARELEGELVAAARAVNAEATRGLERRQIVEMAAVLAAMIENLESAPPARPDR